MCIIFVGNQIHPQFPLVIAANRDEFHQRPTAPTSYWDTSPRILAGKDLEAGGSWMGVQQHGYIAALTNIRNKITPPANAISRGHIVTQYLANPTEFPDKLVQQAERFDGFNLLYGHWQQLHWFNNEIKQPTALSTGIHGLSNDRLNTPWPKVTLGKQLFHHALQQPNLGLPDALFAVLRNHEQAEDTALPRTGVPYDWEKRLSSIFIQSEEYGTRSSTVLLIDHQGVAHWHEQIYDKSGEVTQQLDYQWHFDKK